MIWLNGGALVDKLSESMFESLLQSLNFQILHHFRAKGFVIFTQLQSVDLLQNGSVTLEKHTLKDFLF